MLEFAVDNRSGRTGLASPMFGRRARPPRREPYAEGGVEPRLEELLADPLTEALMRRDGVSETSLRELIIHARRSLRGRAA